MPEACWGSDCGSASNQRCAARPLRRPSMRLPKTGYMSPLIGLRTPDPVEVRWTQLAQKLAATRCPEAPFPSPSARHTGAPGRRHGSRCSSDAAAPSASCRPAPGTGPRRCGRPGAPTPAVVGPLEFVPHHLHQRRLRPVRDPSLFCHWVPRPAGRSPTVAPGLVQWQVLELQR